MATVRRVRWLGAFRVAEVNMAMIEQLEATIEPRVIELTDTRADPPFK